MKAGTSSLHRYLGAHPDIYVPEEKEPDFFLGGEAWDRGLDWYRRLFAPGAGCAARGEASTRYSKDPIFPDVAERAASVIPDVRLVYVLRQPLARIRSHHRHAMAEWGHPPSLVDAWHAHRWEYLAPTRYAHQIDCWLAQFPRDQLLVITSEDLDTRRGDTLAAVFAFLGVDPEWRPADMERRYNRSDDHRSVAAPAQWLRQGVPYRALRRHVPRRLRHAAWRATSRRAPRPDASPYDDVDAMVLAELRDDLRRLAELLPGFHCWGLLDEGPEQ